MWVAEILTLYPQAFPGLLGHSLSGRGRERGLWDLRLINMRDYGMGAHRRVDDPPYGGGGGMVLRADVIGEAMTALQFPQHPRLYLSARGRRLCQQDIERWSRGGGVTLLCGRFGGVDQRLIDEEGFCEVSLGDFILNGGEVAAMAVIEACIRLLPGFVGSWQSLQDESLSDGLLQYPHYTKPQLWRGRSVPAVLSGGDHRVIEAWRQKQRRHLTQSIRPDLWQKFTDET